MAPLLIGERVDTYRWLTINQMMNIQISEACHLFRCRVSTEEINFVDVFFGVNFNNLRRLCSVAASIRTNVLSELESKTFDEQSTLTV
jgi:hypothetical protein